MENLPLEITEIILSRLPADSRLQSREVCTTWKCLIPKPKMGLLYSVPHHKVSKKVEAQFYFSEQNHDDFSGTLTKLKHSIVMPSSSYDSRFKGFMVGSCNGLVCYASYARHDTSERKVYICNPVTGEQIQLPAINKWVDNACDELAIGFGYDRSSHQYKVVRIMFKRVRVYTLQGGGTMWRQKSSVHEECPVSRLSSLLPSVGVFAAGALHWVNQDDRESTVYVKAFDLEHETFNLLPLPSVNHDTNYTGLLVLGGNLCVLQIDPSYYGRVTIWESSKYVQKCGRKNANHWVKKFSIARKNYSWFRPIINTYSCLLWCNLVLSCYDPETNTLRNTKKTLKKFMHAKKPWAYTTTRATPHENSLVSLKAIIGEGCGKREGNRKRKRRTYCC